MGPKSALLVWIVAWCCLAAEGFEPATFQGTSNKQVPCDKTRKILTDSWGIISDGPNDSNYTEDSHCEWLIKGEPSGVLYLITLLIFWIIILANNSRQFITLSFHTMGTECSYDYVFVYDGDSFRSPLLGSFSGKTEPQQVTSSSGYVRIWWACNYSEVPTNQWDIYLNLWYSTKINIKFSQGLRSIKRLIYLKRNTTNSFFFKFSIKFLIW